MAHSIFRRELQGVFFALGFIINEFIKRLAQQARIWAVEWEFQRNQLLGFFAKVLICRLIDRPLPPTMPKGFYHKTQILSWVLSYDALRSPDSLAVTAAGIAVVLSELPHSKAIAGFRIGLVVGDKFVVNPTTKEMEESG